MTDRPILFNAEMVRAILDGRKTQTRRPINPQPPAWIDELHCGEFRKRAPYPADYSGRMGFNYGEDDGDFIPAPWCTGDRLWVRESWRAGIGYDGLSPSNMWPSRNLARVHYEAGGAAPDWAGKLRPSIHMPRWASRITLKVKRVWVEMVQDISESSATREGVEPAEGGYWRHYQGGGDQGWACCARDSFSSLWQSIYGTWDANPWVWCCEFEVCDEVR